MRRLALAAGVAIAGAVLAGTTAIGDHEPRYRPLPSDAGWTTVMNPGVGLEGLTSDRHGNLYSPGRGVSPCPILRTTPSGDAPVVVGNIPAPCNPAGLAFDRDGDLFIADADRIVTLRPNAAAPPTATVYATDVPGANGLAFDRSGRLWVSDGTTAQGRVWRIGSDRVPVEVFRVQPLANDVNVDATGVGGVGRDNRGLPPGTITITPTGRQAANTLGSQHLVANGLAFDRDGTLYVADTARGAIWRVAIDHKGRVRSPTGCDTTFTSNTLCLEGVLVAHPFLEGVDGIVLDRARNILGAVNERNAIVVVTTKGRTVELFRNPVATTRLRNEGPLEFPTSPVIVGRTLCVTSSDGGRRDNFPNSPGEGAKVSCLDEELPVR